MPPLAAGVTATGSSLPLSSSLLSVTGTVLVAGAYLLDVESHGLDELTLRDAGTNVLVCLGFVLGAPPADCAHRTTGDATRKHIVLPGASDAVGVVLVMVPPSSAGAVFPPRPLRPRPWPRPGP